MTIHDNSNLESTTRRLTSVLFIGQGLALLAIFTTSAIGSLGSGELMARVGFASATTIGLGMALIILAASIARIAVRRTNESIA
jgi:hypothetical protein